MEYNVTKCVVKSLEESKEVEKSLQVNCESVTDFANMSVDEILASGGVRKYVFFLRNCADKKDALAAALVNKEANVCVYAFQVGEIVPNKTTCKVINDGEEIGTFTSLTYVAPCKDGFIPTDDDKKGVLSTLKAQVERRIANGTYELE